VTAGLLLSSLSACSGSGKENTHISSGDPVARSIQDVLSLHTEEWMALPGVVGTGIGDCEGEPCIRVFFAQEIPESMEAIPDSVDGYRVDTEVTGSFRPFGKTNQ
jgi:hypothetical protein